jgi:preprotein translocase subunit SecA
MFLTNAFQSLVQQAWPHALTAGASEHHAVAEIRAISENLRRVDDQGLRRQASALKQRLSLAEPRSGMHTNPAAALPAAFGLLAEAARRTLGLSVFDVQLLAGIALARPAIAEMHTGEGKTLAAALPAFLYALTGCGVHVVTPNAYLARRDHEFVGPLFRTLGLSVGLLPEGNDAQAKLAAYECDITYGTGYEFGFDYLRDQVRLLAQRGRRLGDRVRAQLAGTETAKVRPIQRPPAVAIVDEIDSVLIDEACLPLILSGTTHAPGDLPAFVAARDLAAELMPDTDYYLDMQQRQVLLTEQGRRAVHDRLPGAGRLALDRPWETYVQQALYAALLLRRDVDYLVRDGKLLLVDTFTGRIFGDRTWRDGLHQAVEAKESLTLSPDRRTAARISRQRYFGLYHTICGMTGTARGSEREFRSLYRLPVISVPLRIACRRQLLPTRYFARAADKWQAVLRETAHMHAAGRPVLIGTKSIENSRLVSELLTQAGIPHRLLNGTQDEDEARIIAAAGQRAAVTVATNMAGRGTDIKLAAGVAELGGLHLLAAERHESRRIDRQLVGRVARQGDPGSCRFFVSADDSLVQRFAPELAGHLAQAANPLGLESPDLDRLVEAAQVRSEAEAHTQRRHMLAYDTWLDDILAQFGKESG